MKIICKKRFCKLSPEYPHTMESEPLHHVYADEIALADLEFGQEVDARPEAGPRTISEAYRQQRAEFEADHYERMESCGERL